MWVTCLVSELLEKFRGRRERARQTECRSVGWVWERRRILTETVRVVVRVCRGVYWGMSPALVETKLS